ncbi:MAG: DUF3352 domain-containing protein [Anaerolineae bacterium]|nr:DUF3352 domain-containing protein [Anaerolineae bacterium]
MKRLLFGLVTGLFLNLSLATVQAVGVNEGPASMVRYFTANTQLFLSVRIDDGYIETLDGVLSRVTRKLGENGVPVPPISLAALLATNDFGNGITYADIRAWLGDYAAIGLGNLALAFTDPSAFNSGEAPLLAVVAIKDKAAAVAFFERIIPSGSLDKSELGDYTIFTDGGTILAFSNEVMVITNRRDQLPGITRIATLDSRNDLQEAFRRLPAPSYNILAYVDGQSFWNLIFDQLPPDQIRLLEQQGFSRGAIGPVALGATILEGRTLAIDFVQQTNVPVIPGFDPLSAEFLGLIPANIDALLAATNLSGTIDSTLASISLTFQQSGQTDPRQQIDGFLRTFGINLQEDLLSWTTGGYALLFGLDIDAVLNLVVDPSRLETFRERLPADFGLLIEATDPARAKTFARKLSTIIRGAVANDSNLSQQVRVGQTTIGSADVTTLTVDIEVLGEALPVTLVVGADDRAFFLGLQGTAEDVFLGSAKLIDTPAYQDAASFFVPNPSQLLYTNDEGLLETFLPFVISAALVPSIGNIFGQIADDLQSSDDGLAQTVQNIQDTANQVALVARAFNAVVASSSATGAILGDGWSTGRLALTLEP